MAEFTPIPLPGSDTLPGPASLLIDKARTLAEAILRSDFATLVSCQVVTGSGDTFFRPGDEVVTFELLLQVGQKPVNDIREREIISVHFDARDRSIPWVYALRRDFPKVPHRNALYFEEPQCLCIYENTYDELRVNWRSARFLEDIRIWLELSAEDKLHQEDQPLEAFLVSTLGTIILPHNYQPDETFHIYTIATLPGHVSLLASRSRVDRFEPYQAQVLSLRAEPQMQGIMGLSPNNLFDLHRLLVPAGLDLLAAIKARLQELTGDGDLNARLMIFLELPKIKDGKVEPGEQDHYVFLSADPIGKIGLELDIYSQDPESRTLANVLLSPVKTEAAKDLHIGALIPQVQLKPDYALLLSGKSQLWDRREQKIFQIGTGALGSQFFMNNARSGFGRWVLTDDDLLMPHNTIRHSLGGDVLGMLKDVTVARQANLLFGGEAFSEALCQNYLHPVNTETVRQKLQEASIVVDVSTSIAVARHLANRKDIHARRVSMFLSPQGYDLVMLVEDQARSQPLDVLEYQYYQQLTERAELEGHLATTPGKRLSVSCRDITARIPPEAVAIHAGIATAAFPKLTGEASAASAIWRINQATMAVSHHTWPPDEVDTFTKDGWEIIVSKRLLRKISEARIARLPNETGGILIGGHDLEHKKVYLTGTILSPKDSVEYPTSYIRGIDGVEAELKRIAEITADHLMYAGEWHSHPDHCGLHMSGDDQKLFAYIHEHMSAIGLPAFMLIAGENGTYSVQFRS